MFTSAAKADRELIKPHSQALIGQPGRGLVKSA